MFKPFLVFILTLFLSAEVVAQVTPIEETDLLGCWSDSREENKPKSNELTYRPCDYKSFPFSRFRFEFQLSENGDCSYLVIGKTDVHYKELGTWKFDATKNLLEICDPEGATHKTFYVHQIDNNLLVLKNQN